MVKIGDIYKLQSSTGMNYTIRIVNVSDYRPPEERYAGDITDEDGNSPNDVIFFGDEFLKNCKYIEENIDE